MSKFKTKITTEAVVDFLKKDFSKGISNLEIIKAGELSQAFSFHVGESGFIIRVNKENEGFEKDVYAYNNFHSEDVPIPRTISTGQFGEGLHYSITEKCSGKTVDLFSREEVLGFIAPLLNTLDAIHEVEVSDKKGFGWWDLRGEAGMDSWRSHLLDMVRHCREDIQQGTAGGLLEEGLVMQMVDPYVEMVENCPEVHGLVHVDFGFNNLLSDGREITGVIDWANSAYGDFLYDAAWLGFWDRKVGYKKVLADHYKAHALPEYERRILCYELHIGIGSLFFFSKSSQSEPYKWTKEKVNELVAEGHREGLIKNKIYA